LVHITSRYNKTGHIPHNISRKIFLSNHQVYSLFLQRRRI
jgi:hypothetical protein